MLTVTTPATDRALLTPAELRSALPGVEVQDQALTALNGRIEATICKACNVARAGAVPPTLRLESVVDTYRLKSQQNVLILSRRPTVTIVSVVEDGAALAAEDYEVDAGAGMLYRLSGDARVCWPACKIVVTYSAGWETVPDDLKEAAAKMARVLWSEGAKADPNLKRESIPGVIDREWWVSQNDDKAMPQEVLDLLAPYMNHYIG